MWLLLLILSTYLGLLESERFRLRLRTNLHFFGKRSKVNANRGAHFLKAVD